MGYRDRRSDIPYEYEHLLYMDDVDGFRYRRQSSRVAVRGFHVFCFMKTRRMADERMNERTSPVGVGEHRMDILVATVKSSTEACHVIMLCLCM